MFPAETKVLMARVIVQLQPEHERNKGDAIRQLTFKMMNQGLGRSSAFDQAMVQLYCDSFKRFAENVWSEVKRVLEETGFDAYPNCEQDLIPLLNGALSPIQNSDSQKLASERHMSSKQPKTIFEFRSKLAVEKVETEARIFCAKLRSMKTSKTQAPAQTNNFYLLGPNSRVNQGSTDNSVNIVSEADLFPKLRLAIEAQISDVQAKERLLAMVDEGEKLPKRTDIYNSWFAKFLSLAADSIGVVQPFIPALAQLLAQVTT